MIFRCDHSRRRFGPGIRARLSGPRTGKFTRMGPVGSSGNGSDNVEPAASRAMPPSSPAAGRVIIDDGHPRIGGLGGKLRISLRSQVRSGVRYSGKQDVGATCMTNHRTLFTGGFRTGKIVASQTHLTISCRKQVGNRLTLLLFVLSCHICALCRKEKVCAFRASRVSS